MSGARSRAETHALSAVMIMIVITSVMTTIVFIATKTTFVYIGHMIMIVVLEPRC